MGRPAARPTSRRLPVLAPVRRPSPGLGRSRSGRPSSQAAWTSASTPSARPASTCCCSIPPTTRSLGRSSRSIGTTTVREPIWHRHVPGLEAGALYGYSVRGPWAPERARRFDPSKVLLDPYGRGVAVPAAYRPIPAGTTDARFRPDEERGHRRLGLRLGGRSPHRATVPRHDHLRGPSRGFTADPIPGVAAERRGTYLGFIEKIPYLVDLGVTAVELLPIFQFDPWRARRPAQLLGLPARVVLRAPSAVRDAADGPRSGRRVPRPGQGAAPAGLEVILDVVFNHTAEGGADGPPSGSAASPTTTTTSHDANGGYIDVTARATRSTPTARSCAG